MSGFDSSDLTVVLDQSEEADNTIMAGEDVIEDEERVALLQLLRDSFSQVHNYRQVVTKTVKLVNKFREDPSKLTTIDAESAKKRYNKLKDLIKAFEKVYEDWIEGEPDDEEQDVTGAEEFSRQKVGEASRVWRQLVKDGSDAVKFFHDKDLCDLGEVILMEKTIDINDSKVADNGQVESNPKETQGEGGSSKQREANPKTNDIPRNEGADQRMESDEVPNGPTGPEVVIRTEKNLNSTLDSSVLSVDRSGADIGWLLARPNKIKHYVGKDIDKVRGLVEEGNLCPSTLSLLERIESRIGRSVGSEFCVLFDRLTKVVENVEVLTDLEDWRETHLGIVESLKDRFVDDEAKKKQEKEQVENVNLAEIVAAASAKPTFGTVFPKRKPPSFKSADILDYLEFKKKWGREVHSLGPPEAHEVAILKENLPDNAQLKLHNKETLSQIWVELDKLFGDKMLLSQKLKRKMKNISIIATEDHEKVIEIFDNVMYLNDRLTLAESQQLLDLDPDYLASIYQNLPTSEKLLWDSEVTDIHEGRWEMFKQFLEKRQCCT